MVKEQRSTLYTRCVVIATALLIGFGGGRLIKAGTLMASAQEPVHAAPVAYTQADNGDIAVEYADSVQVVVADDL